MTKVLSETCVVCSRHFDKRFVQRTFKHVINGQTVELDCERPTLTEDAISTIFPDAPSYFTKPLPKKRAERNLDNSDTPPAKCRAPNNNPVEVVETLACTVLYKSKEHGTKHTKRKAEALENEAIPLE
ncbi:hypothetical protein HPB49_004767 [Dermacentor silvarum]|uniref:Uncharacterized protein n=1 Tax=Dermacentor silvarum TaxID=543639 RepID=A0ACB8DAP8_DERSI|nr:hypothetical protein HPB49_004767 [Dermacentor silvarum]